MTECERIVNCGIIPASFLKEEVRCEFLITKERKKLWTVLIDLFIKFAEVCQKYDLKYWADGGTMLGAVRHNGFIPWDDDLDVMMPREDYNRLMEIGPAEFNAPYFFQTPHTDPNYAYSFAKLRNSNTSCIPRVFQKAGFNHGIPIDIFPLDYINMETFDEDMRRISDHIMRCSSYMKRNSIDLLNERQMECFRKYKTKYPAYEYDQIQAIASNPNYYGSEDVADSVVTIFKPSARIWKASWFEKTIMHKFEMIEIPVPAEFDLRLKKQYGDYMTYPPVEDRGNWHTDELCDPDKSYTYYI